MNNNSLYNRINKLSIANFNLLINAWIIEDSINIKKFISTKCFVLIVCSYLLNLLHRNMLTKFYLRRNLIEILL